MIIDIISPEFSFREDYTIKIFFYKFADYVVKFFYFGKFLK